MARFNEVLVGRYNRFAQKLLAMKGPASLVTLSDEIQAVVPLFHGAENRYLEGWERFGSTNSAAAGGAGNRNGFRIRNPAGSNLLVVIEKITISGTLFDLPLVNIDTLNTDFTPITPFRFDARGRTNPSAIVSVGTGVISANEVFQGAFAANTALDVINVYTAEIPILPGDACTVWGGVLNQALTVAMWWRERFLEDSERK